MSKNVIITTDSVCDMPPDLLERYQVKKIPLTVIEGDRSYQDGVDITPDEIISRVNGGSSLPRTSAINVEEYHLFCPYLFLTVQSHFKGRMSKTLFWNIYT